MTATIRTLFIGSVLAALTIAWCVVTLVTFWIATATVHAFAAIILVWTAFWTAVMWRGK